MNTHENMVVGKEEDEEDDDGWTRCWWLFSEEGNTEGEGPRNTR